MTYSTDERLKGYLDTNQLQRERMCLAILAIDKRFTNVRPRHPRGGPDGGGDIDATFQGEQKAIGAIGFVNQATDSNGHKTKAKKKFNADLKSALKAEPDLKVFVFFTNVNLTVSEKDALILEAKASGLAHCEVIDRERMRLVLDGADGLSIRFQALGMPMSEAEQATFFARWGDDIQNVIVDGFGEIKKSLNRMQFLQEMRFPLANLVIMLELDREYDAVEIGHFRFFVSLSLMEPRDGLIMVTFGTTDRAGRFEAKSVKDVEAILPGIEHSMTGVRWERRIPGMEDDSHKTRVADDDADEGIMVQGFTSIGQEKVRFLRAAFGYGVGLFRFGSYLCLSDLDGSMLALFVNRSLADKVKAIHFYGNEYKLGEHGAFRKDKPVSEFRPDALFTPDELADEWVRIMKDGPFRIQFSETTPVRVFEPIEASNSLAKPAMPTKKG